MPNEIVLGLVAILAAVFFTTLGYLGARMLAPKPEALSSLPTQVASIRYRALLRLLSEDDFQYLRSQPGYRPEIASQLRKRRVQLMRVYLRQMSSDFGRLHVALRSMVAAGADRPDISRALVEQQFTFVWRITEARFRLALYGFGVQPPRLRGLVDTLESMQRQVREFEVAGAQSAA